MRPDPSTRRRWMVTATVAIVAAGLAAVVIDGTRDGDRDTVAEVDPAEPTPTVAASATATLTETPMETSTSTQPVPTLVRSGPMPGKLVAVSDAGEVVSVDVETLETTLLWDGAEVTTEATAESTASFIESLAVAGPGQILMGVCCEPAAGQVWLLDIASGEPPRKLPIDGSHPTVSQSGILAVSDGLGVKGIRVARFLDDSDELIPTYYFEGLAGADADVAWLGNDMVVFDRRNGGAAEIVTVNISTGATTVRGSDIGWERPSGSPDAATYTVVEQCCWDPVNGVVTDSATILAVSDPSIAPVAVATLAGGVAATDLDRGWLLVTRSSGEVGVVDPDDGSFTTIVVGMRTAVWFK